MSDRPFFPLGPLHGELQFNGRRMLLLRDFAYQDGDVSVTVPAGATTDFNSIPRGLWNYFPPWEHPEAGVIHDYLYRTPAGLSRETCDTIHRRILELTGASWFKRQSAYRALRLFGGAAWEAHRRAELLERVSRRAGAPRRRGPRAVVTPRRRSSDHTRQEQQP